MTALNIVLGRRVSVVVEVLSQPSVTWSLLRLRDREIYPPVLHSIPF